MNWALLKKNIREARLMLLICIAAVFFFCWIRVWVVTQMDTSDFQTIIDTLPSAIRRFIPVQVEWLISYAGRISLTFDDAIVVICIAAWSVARGTDVVSGEIDRGTMEMTLSQPVSRTQVLTSHTVVTVVGLALIVLAVWGGIYAGIHSFSAMEKVQPTIALPFHVPGVGVEMAWPFGEPTERLVPLSERVDPHIFWPAVANLFALGLFLVGFSTLMSSWDRSRRRTVGLVVGIIVAFLALKILGMAMNENPLGEQGELKRHWLMYSSPFTAYEPTIFVRAADLDPGQAWSLLVYGKDGRVLDLGAIGYDLILVFVALLALIGATVIFNRRDLPAPL